MIKTITSLLLCTVIINTQAAVHCVSTSQEFKNALQTAGSNQEDDVIRLKNGDYFTINNTQFLYSYTENNALEISGGWFDFNQLECFSQTLNPMNTTLDANDQSIVLMFTYNNDYPGVSFKISNLSILNGYHSQNVGSGIQMALPNNHNGDVIIDRVYFAGNDSDINGALTITWPKTVTIKNSVFQFNKSGEGDGVVQINLRAGNNGLYFINNTMLYNSHDVQIPDASTTTGLKVNIHSMDVDGFPKAFIANNLFWYNENTDIYLPTIGTSYFFNNNFQTLQGHPDNAGDNMSQTPMLAPQILDFTPVTGSPLIDAGKPAPVLITDPPYPFEESWGYGSQDFDGFSRVINNRVDIGAVEAPPEIPIFKDGFE
jgi:hypothetical protein